MNDTKTILDQLRSPDKSEVREAAFQAGEAAMLDAVPLLAELLRDGNLGVQEAADRALRQIGGPETVREVIPLLRSEKANVRNLSMDILREVGQDGLSALLELARDEDPDIRIFVTDILGSSKSAQAVECLCQSLLTDPEVNVRYQAAVSLGNLGQTDGADCLNRAMKDEEWVQYSVIEALAKLGQSSSVSALVEAMDRSSELVQSMIVDALGNIGNVKAVPMLIKRMPNQTQAMRNKIVKAVVLILGGKSLALLSDSEREIFHTAMLTALDDDDIETQDAAVRGLAHLGGEPASWAILNLAARLHPDSDAERLEATIKALSRIGLNPALAQGVDSDDSTLAHTAVEVLGRIPGPDAAKVLMGAFEGKNRDMQRSIVSALDRVADATAVDFFVDVLENNSDGTVLKSAISFLGAKGESEEVGEKLFGLLDHKYPDVVEAALDACALLGGEKMSERFRVLTADSDPNRRLMGVYGLGHINADKHFGLISDALRDEQPEIRKVALEALAMVCPVRGEALTLIVNGLADEDRDVRLAVVELLGKCGGAASVEHLVNALDDREDWVRVRAVQALARQGAREVVARFVPLLESGSKLVVIKTTEALGELGGAEAFQLLLQIAEADDPEVANVAQAAIECLQAGGA